MTQTQKRKLKPAWLIAILALLTLGGLFILPINPGVRALGYFLYFYICIDIASQIYLSHKKNMKDEDQKAKNISGE